MPEVKPHPAKFSDAIMDKIRFVLLEEARRKGRKLKVLDPFAGVGGIHDTRRDGHISWGVELEPEWAYADKRTLVGDAHELPFPDDTFDATVTSPVYPNRMTDHHNAKDTSKRYTYKHTLGRDPSEGSSTVLKWGPKWREFHADTFLEAWRCTDGLFVLNMSNHFQRVKKGEDSVEQRVVEWCMRLLLGWGFYLVEAIPVETKRMRNGANRNLRVEKEFILVLRTPS